MKGYFSFASNKRGKTITFIRKEWFFILITLRYFTSRYVEILPSSQSISFFGEVFFFSISGRNRRVITNDNPLGDKAPSKLTLRWFIIRQSRLSGESKASDKGGGGGGETFLRPFEPQFGLQISVCVGGGWGIRH